MGKAIIFSAPSGCGKTTIINMILKEFKNLEFSISATTRDRRDGEQHGREYYFLSVPQFNEKQANDEFIEWEEVYKDNFYGTPQSELNRIWNNGNNVIFDVDVKGGLNIKKQLGENALLIFIMPPSIPELERRLKGRGTDTEEVISNRIKKAEYEMTFADKFDEIIVNDDLQKSVEKSKEILNHFLNKQ